MVSAPVSHAGSCLDYSHRHLRYAPAAMKARTTSPVITQTQAGSPPSSIGSAAVAAGVADGVGRGVGPAVAVAVGRGVAIGSGATVAVAVGSGAAVGIGVDVAVGDGMGDAVGTGDGVGEAVVLDAVVGAGLGVGDWMGASTANGDVSLTSAQVKAAPSISSVDDSNSTHALPSYRASTPDPSRHTVAVCPASRGGETVMSTGPARNIWPVGGVRLA